MTGLEQYINDIKQTLIDLDKTLTLLATVLGEPPCTWKKEASFINNQGLRRNKWEHSTQKINSQLEQINLIINRLISGRSHTNPATEKNCHTLLLLKLYQDEALTHKRSLYITLTVLEYKALLETCLANTSLQLAREQLEPTSSFTPILHSRYSDQIDKNEFFKITFELIRQLNYSYIPLLRKTVNCVHEEIKQQQLWQKKQRQPTHKKENLSKVASYTAVLQEINQAIMAISQEKTYRFSIYKHKPHSSLEEVYNTVSALIKAATTPRFPEDIPSLAARFAANDYLLEIKKEVLLDLCIEQTKCIIWALHQVHQWWRPSQYQKLMSMIGLTPCLQNQPIPEATQNIIKAALANQVPKKKDKIDQTQQIMQWADNIRGLNAEGKEGFINYTRNLLMHMSETAPPSNQPQP